MVALIAATPQMGKLLRPLCRMRGLATEFLTPATAAAPNLASYRRLSPRFMGQLRRPLVQARSSVVSDRMRPFSSTTTRSASAWASSSSWETKTVVRPSVSCR